MEKLASEGLIDLFYGDESQISSEGYVPYGWQFPDEKVSILTQKGYKFNIFGLISRDNQCRWVMSEQNINHEFIIKELDEMSLQVKKKTVVVLDNARIHQNKKMKQYFTIWQNRGLYIFFLPTYSPHLNIAETMWRILKTKWIRPEDYLSKDHLRYAINRAMNSIGNLSFIKFKPFNIN